MFRIYTYHLPIFIFLISYQILKKVKKVNFTKKQIQKTSKNFKSVRNSSTHVIVFKLKKGIGLHMLLVVSIKAKGECDVSKIVLSLCFLTLLVLMREAINKFITNFVEYS
jgi:uncharacterized membrane protein